MIDGGIYVGEGWVIEYSSGLVRVVCCGWCVLKRECGKKGCYESDGGGFFLSRVWVLFVVFVCVCFVCIVYYFWDVIWDVIWDFIMFWEFCELVE